MLRVLVVDDEATLRKNIARSLRRAGFEVITAADGAGARRALDGGDADVLCLDIHLPDEDGLDLLEEVRQTSQGIPVIVMSGAATLEHRSRATRLGVEGFLSKPFCLAELKVLVARTLSKRGNK
jgi:DNA-binding response OmpR family regulator